MLTAEAVTRSGRLTEEATYLLPIRKSAPEDLSELGAYLEGLAERLEVIVVDGSPPEVFEANAAFWPSCLHIAPAPARRVANGKVWGVLTGLDRASCDKVIIADEDVRYDAESLSRALLLLDDAEVVRPQNYFEPLPWHAVWDTGRTLLNRAFDADWPGTLAVRRRLLERTNGYDGNCLFENLELVRTVIAAGGREARPLDLFVRRQPCDVSHFLSQRIRQAYDEFARPGRLAGQLALLPGAALMLAFRPRLFLLALAAVWSAAEYGRRRERGTSVFPFLASLAAPLWLTERAVCSWLAVVSRLRYGGIRYHGIVISAAATPASVLEHRYQALQKEDAR
jgi:hypothetical protein